MPLMTGRQAFLEILHAAGVEYIIGNPGTTELPLMDVLPEGISKGLAARMAVESLKDAVSFAGIGSQVNQSHFLPSMDALPRLLNVLCQGDFPRAQEQHSPGQFGPGATFWPSTALPAAVREHVCRASSLTRIHLFQFIQEQQIIIMRSGHTFQAIRRRAPMFHTAGLTPDAGAHESDRSFPLTGGAAQVNTAAFTPERHQQGSRKSHAACQQETAIAGAETGNFFLPFLERTLLPVAFDGVLQPLQGNLLIVWALAKGGIR